MKVVLGRTSLRDTLLGGAGKKGRRASWQTSALVNFIPLGIPLFFLSRSSLVVNPDYEDGGPGPGG